MSRAAALAVLALAGAASAGQAQGVTLGIGRYLADGGDWTSYRLAYVRPAASPLRFELGGLLLSRGDGRLWGVEGLVSAFRGGSPGPFMVGGLVAGVGTGPVDDVWAGWSAGAGWEFRLGGRAGASVEARYRHLTQDGIRGVELAAGVTIRLGARRPAAGAADGGPSGGTPAPTRAGTTADSAAATALDAMGTPYRWGGTAQGDGFDCSGLIQYAYGVHGVRLPRRSEEQAQAGTAVPTDRAALRAGDILAFAGAPGGPVTHVGLYLGDGRFIHSATGGVRIDLLDPGDPAGGWWFARWVGARRVVP